MPRSSYVFVERWFLAALLTTSLVLLSLPFLLMAAFHSSPEMSRMCPMCAAVMPLGPAFGAVIVAGIVGFVVALILLLESGQAGSQRAGQTDIGLLEEERKVVKLLSERGEVTQRDIARELSISKVKAHRLVKGLERRGIVTTEPRGRTKVVRLRQRTSQA